MVKVVRKSKIDNLTNIYGGKTGGGNPSGVRSYVGGGSHDFLYDDNWLVKKASDKPAKDSLRTFINGDLDDELNPINGRKVITKAVGMARAFGGSVIVMLANDNQLPEVPMDPGAEIGRIVAIERSQISRVTDGAGYFFPNEASYIINGIHFHESRVIEVSGMTSSHHRLLSNDFWGTGIIELAYESIDAISDVWRGIKRVADTASIGMVKIPGLHEASCNTELMSIISGRLQQAASDRSLYGDIALDSEESFEWINRTFSGIKEITDIFQLRLAANLDIPESILFGKKTGGLGDTSDEEQSQYNDLLLDIRNDVVEPILNRFADHYGKSWEWIEVNHTTPMELADIRLKSAQALEIEQRVAGLNEVEARSVMKLTGNVVHEELTDTVPDDILSDLEDEETNNETR